MNVVLTFLGLAGGVLALAAPSAPRAPAQIDHLILGVRDLDDGIRQFEARTGVRPAIGGEHPGRGTRNALASLGDGHYVEILAPQAGAADSERVDALRGLVNLTPVGWAVGVRDMEAARARLSAAGFTLSDVMPGSRARPDGSLLEWRTFEVAKPPIAGAPFFIRWGDRATHPSEDSPAGCRLERLRVITPGADDLRRVLAALPLDVAVEAGGRGGLDIALRCRTGTVTFSAAAAPSVPR